MPTLLQINTTCNAGSHGRLAELIGIEAMAAGYRSVIAFGRGTAVSASETIRISGIADRYMHALETRLFDRHGLGSRTSTSALIRHIERIAPDIVHLHNIHGYYLNYPQLFDALGSMGMPVVWTLHDCWALTGHCAMLPTEGCDKWHTGCRACAHRHSYPASWLWDRSEANFRLKETVYRCIANMYVVTVCDHQAGLVRSSMLRGRPIRVIRNGIDIDTFRPCAKGSIGHRTIVGVANVWNEWKGLDDFIALRKLLPQSVEIKLVGVTPRQAAALPDGITGITHVSDPSELARIYSEADVFVNLSHPDNYPTTLLEALACGTPVVTYDTGGCREALDTSCGIVVPQCDIEAAAQAIRQIISTPEASGRFTPAICRNYATAHHSHRTCTASYLALYSTLLHP